MITKRKSFILSLIVIVIFFSSINIVLSQEGQQTSKNEKALAQIDTTLWNYLSATDRSQWIISKADSEKAIKEYVIPGATIFRKAAEVNDKINKGRTTIEQEASNLINLFEQAKDDFEQALRLNPFDNYVRPWLINTYSSLEQLYAYKEQPAKRLTILQNLLYLKKHPKDRIYFFNNIGNIYRQFELYAKARDNYQLAVEAIFEDDEAAIDTARLFENIYLRGEMQMKLYEDEPALTSFSHAKLIAPDENWRNRITNYIEFINWDAGNILASEKYYEARRLYGEKRYDDAEIVFLELLGIVKTEKATDQTHLALSRIQFYQLNKKEEAIERLWKVVNRSTLNLDSGVPIDSAYQDFWEQYAQMCLLMGIENYNVDKRTSFAYFLKSSQIEGSSRAKAFLNLAMMSLQNPQICLNYCTRAMDYQQQLNKEEKKLLYETTYQAYLKQGNFDEALEWFKRCYEMSS